VYESVIDTDNDHTDNEHTGRLARQVVELLRQGRGGLVTDVDGTISPIVARPQDAFIVARARAALEGLRSHLALVGVVTGRSVDDARRLVGVDGLTYIGNHGLEVWRDGRAETLPEALAWVPIVSDVLREVGAKLDPALRPGVLFENKGATASLHYRLTPDPDRARTVLLESLAASAAGRDLRIEEGRRVINLLPPLQVSKGSAVTWLVRANALDSMVYLGDDITDTHAFQALRSLGESAEVRALSIGVVGPETPLVLRESADASVPSVNAVADLLCAVLEGLQAGDTMGPRAPGVGSE
jgi:trehalose 6-phosphate phosphatase